MSDLDKVEKNLQDISEGFLNLLKMQEAELKLREELNKVAQRILQSVYASKTDSIPFEEAQAIFKEFNLTPSKRFMVLQMLKEFTEEKRVISFTEIGREKYLYLLRKGPAKSDPF